MHVHFAITACMVIVFCKKNLQTLLNHNNCCKLILPYFEILSKSVNTGTVAKPSPTPDNPSETHVSHNQLQTLCKTH